MCARRVPVWEGPPHGGGCATVACMQRPPAMLCDDVQPRIALGKVPVHDAVLVVAEFVGCTIAWLLTMVVGLKPV